MADTIRETGHAGSRALAQILPSAMSVIALNHNLGCHGVCTSAGINKGHVEAMESRLKQDVLNEAEKYGNQVNTPIKTLIHHSTIQKHVQEWLWLEGELLQGLSMGLNAEICCLF